jgi:acyl carrier protein
MPEQNQPLSFDEFRQFLSDTLGVADYALQPETSLLYELGIESLKMVELMVQLEQHLGMRITSDAAWEIGTVEDAYKFYLSQANGKNGRATS